MTFANDIPTRLVDATPVLVRVPTARIADGRTLDGGTAQQIANNVAHAGRENSRRLIFSSFNPLPLLSQYSTTGDLVSDIWDAFLWLTTTHDPSTDPPSMFCSWRIGRICIAAPYTPTCDLYDASVPSSAATPYRRTISVKFTANNTAPNPSFAMACIMRTTASGSLVRPDDTCEISDRVELTGGGDFEIELDPTPVPPLAQYGSARASQADVGFWPRCAVWLGFHEVVGGLDPPTLAVSRLSIRELRTPAGDP